jgi:hypothetical protein
VAVLMGEFLIARAATAKGELRKVTQIERAGPVLDYPADDVKAVRW